MVTGFDGFTTTAPVAGGLVFAVSRVYTTIKSRGGRFNRIGGARNGSGHRGDKWNKWAIWTNDGRSQWGGEGRGRGNLAVHVGLVRQG